MDSDMKNLYNLLTKKVLLQGWLGIWLLVLPVSLAAQEVLIGSGTSTNSGVNGPPLTRNYTYSASEQIYPGTAINTTGIISELGFYKSSGSDVNPIENVSIYLKKTDATTVGTTTSLSGYTLVFEGSFSNNGTSGWMSVPLSSPFTFDEAGKNLSVLVVKGAQTYISSGYPVYRNAGGTSDNSASYYRSDGTAWSSSSSMTRTSIIKPQLRLVFTPCTTRPVISGIAPSSTQATVNFSCESCTGTYIVEYGANGFIPGAGASAGGGAITNGASSAITISALSPGTTYDVYVRNNCGSGYSVNSLKYTFTTLCDTYTLPYTQNFDGVTAPALPACFSVSNSNGDAYQWQTSGSYRNTTPNSIYLYTGSSNASDDWFFTPAYYFEANKSYRLTFRYRTGSGSSSYEHFKIAYGAYVNAAAMTHLAADYNSVRSSSFAADTVYFTPAANGINYIGFHAYSAASKEYIAIDDITVAVSPVTCFPPTAVTAVPTSDTSAVLSWNAPVAGVPQSYVWEIRSSGSAGSGSAGLAASGTTSSSVLTAVAKTLAGSTTYTLYVRTDCVVNGYSSWAAGSSFKTPCAAVNVPYTEDFSSTSGSSLPNCTVVQDKLGSTTWTTALVSSSRVLQYTQEYSTGADDWFFTRGINLEAGKTYRLKFSYRNSNASYVNKLKVAVGTWANDAYMTDIIFNNEGISVTSYEEGVGYYTPSVSGIYYLGFNVFSARSQYYLYVDDIVFDEYPPCIRPLTQPAGLVLTPGYTTVTGSFSAAVPAADQYLVVRTLTGTPPADPVDGVEYTVGGADLGGYIEHTGNGVSFTTNYLDLGTTYYYWIYAYNHSSCSGGPLYNTVSPLHAAVTTLSCSAYTTKTYTNTTTNQNININWSAISWTPSGTPGPCDNVIITNQNTSTSSYALNITLNTAVNVNNLEIKAEYGTTINNKPIQINGDVSLPLVVNGDLKISGNAGANSAAEIRYYNNGGTLVVKGNTILGLPADNVHIAFGQNGGSPRFEFRGDLTLNNLAYIRNNGLGTWIFDGKTGQTITNNSISTKSTPPVSFNSLTIGNANAPTVNLAGTSKTYLRGGDLLINSGAALSLPNGQSLNQYSANVGALAIFDGATLKLGGTTDGWSNGNNFPKNFALNYIESGATVEYNGQAAQELAALDYSNLTVNNGADIYVPANVTVDGILHFEHGKLVTGNDPLLLTGNAIVTGAGEDKYVEGWLSKTINTGAGQKKFEIGNAISYTPLTLETFGNIGAGTITVKSIEGAHPELATSGVSSAKYVNAYWEVQAAGVNGIDSARLTFQYNPGDLAGGADPAKLEAARRKDTSWTIFPTVNTPEQYRSIISGITDIAGSYILAEVVPECEAIIDSAAASTVPLAVTSSSTISCAVLDSEWHYFRDASGGIIAAVNARGQDLGAVTLEIELDEQNGPFVGGTCSASGLEEYFIGRIVKINSEKVPVSPVSFRLFFTDAEYQSFKNRVVSQGENYQKCFGSTNTYEDIIISAFFAGHQDAEPVSEITRTLNGPQGSYQFEFDLRPSTEAGRFAGGRFDPEGTVFYLHGSGGTGSVLPVELTRFTGAYKEPGILLEWATASEKNNERFEILRSGDSVSFEKIGEVAGSGTSSAPKVYQFTDLSIQPGRIYYYQLKQVDYDGTYEKSVIIAVETGIPAWSISDFYPNPTSGKSRIQILVPDSNNIPFSLQLFTVDGRLLRSISDKLSKGNNLLELDFTGLPAGSYISRIQIGKDITANKLVNIVQ